MKRILLSMAMLAITATVSAQFAAHISQRLFSPAKFGTLIIEGNFNVVLEESERLSVSAKGDPRFMSKLRITQYQQTLRLKETYNPSAGHNPTNTVVIAVKDLKQILVIGNAKIISANTLQSPELKIFMNAAAQVNITNSGRVRVDTGEEYELVKGK